MGRYAQPLEVAQLKGADKVHPERYRNETPKSERPIGDYPAVRSLDPADCWKDISDQCIPGVLTGADRIMLELAANLLSEYRTDPVKFPAAKYTHLTNCLARFGMSPSDRTKLGVGKKDDDDDFETL